MTLLSNESNPLKKIILFYFFSMWLIGWKGCDRTFCGVDWEMSINLILGKEYDMLSY
jgi:hypothetical protein